MSNGTFEELGVGSCQGTHVQPFSTDLHLLFLECKQSAWLIAIIFGTILIKLGQNWMYTTIGQLQRELLQIPSTDRNCCTQKVLLLLWWEFVTGVVGILSVLIITGNNAIIWLTIIVANMVGVVLAYTNIEADHHSTALELINMLERYPSNGERPKCEDEEARRTFDAITKLRKILHRNKDDVKYIKEDFDATEGQPLVRRNLIL